MRLSEMETSSPPRSGVSLRAGDRRMADPNLGQHEDDVGVRPTFEKIVVSLSDGKQFVAAPELMTMLGSGLGDASREAMAHPLTTIATDNLQERKR
jgi:hypothetical protein